MAFPNSPVQPPRSAAPNQPPAGGADWRCLECGKLLGVRRGGKLHVRMHGHDYLVTLPAEAVCRNCGTVNRT